MKTPIHNFKRRVVHADNSIAPYWTANAQNGWLASGIKDKNGVEIFEGDKVIFGEDDSEGVIVFKNAMFQIKFMRYGVETYSVLGHAKEFLAIEVVGHIEED